MTLLNRILGRPANTDYFSVNVPQEAVNPGLQTLSDETGTADSGRRVLTPEQGFESSGGDYQGSPPSGQMDPELAGNIATGMGIAGTLTGTPALGIGSSFLGAAARGAQGNFAPAANTITSMVTGNPKLGALAEMGTGFAQGNLSGRNAAAGLAGLAVPGYGLIDTVFGGRVSDGLFGSNAKYDKDVNAATWAQPGWTGANWGSQTFSPQQEAAYQANLAAGNFGGPNQGVPGTLGALASEQAAPGTYGYAADGMGPPTSAANSPSSAQQAADAGFFGGYEPSGGGDTGGGGPSYGGGESFGGDSHAGGFYADGGMVGLSAPRYADGGQVGQPMLAMGFADGGQMGGEISPRMVDMKVNQLLQNPQVRNQLVGRAQALMQSGELTPQEVQTMGQIAEASIQNPKLYPQLRQFVAQQGMSPLPPAFDPTVIMKILAISRALQQTPQGGAAPGQGQPTPPGQVPPTDQAMVAPPPGMARGGMIHGPGTGRSDSIGTVNESTGQPVKVANGEFIIPKHVVDAKGSEYFYKLLERYPPPKEQA